MTVTDDIETDSEFQDEKVVLPELVRFTPFPGAVPSTTFLEWQLTPELVKRLEAKKFVKPYVVIIVRTVTKRHGYGDEDYTYNEYCDTDMHVVPLTELTRYISFSRPGINEVCAIVVDLDRETSKKLAKINANIRNSYNSCFNDDGLAMERLKDAAGWRNVIETARVVVQVSQGSFAPEPPAWNKQLVSQFFRGKDFDQCHFGKRSFISGMLLVPVLPLSYIGKLLLTLLGAFFGLSKLNVKQFLRPFEFNPMNILDTVERSIWVEKKEKDKDGVHLMRSPLFRAINPVVLLGPALIAFGIFQIPKHHGNSKGISPWCDWGWWKTLLVVDAAVLSLFIVAASVIFLTPVVAAILRMDFIQKPLHRLSSLIGGSENVRNERLRKELQALAMNPDATDPADSRATQKPRRSVAVLFARLKAEVCKPYARG